METFTLLIIIASGLLNLLLFYIIIRSATKAKYLAENSDAQLQVLIEIALKGGVDTDRISEVVDLVKIRSYRKIKKDFANGKISQEDYEKLKQEYA